MRRRQGPRRSLLVLDPLDRSPLDKTPVRPGRSVPFVVGFTATVLGGFTYTYLMIIGSYLSAACTDRPAGTWPTSRWYITGTVGALVATSTGIALVASAYGTNRWVRRPERREDETLYLAGRLKRQLLVAMALSTATFLYVHGTGLTLQTWC